MKTLKTILIMTTFTMATFSTLTHASYYEDTDYSNSSDSFTVSAKVISVTPIFKYVTYDTPREHCYKKRVTQTNYYDGDRNGRMLLGGIIGGVIGNNIGHGKSRKARAVVGALVGSHIGSSIADQHAYSSQQTGYQTQCETQHVSETRKKVAGYDVSYRFRGRIMTTQLPYHPGRRIKLNVNVSPVIN